MSHKLTPVPVWAGRLRHTLHLTVHLAVHLSVRVLDYARLTRPSNAAGAALLVLAGSRLSMLGLPDAVAPPLDWFATWLAVGAMWCIASSGYVANDVVDVTEDRINKPNRPLPSGRLDPAHALVFARVMAVAGILLAMPLGLVAAVAALGVVGLLSLYNHRLKSTPMVGNLLIGLLAGCALMAGVVVQVGLRAALQSGIILPAAVLAAAITAREMLKTLEDIPGDQAARRRTLATVLGPRRTLWAYGGAAMLAWLLMPGPVVWLGFRPAYLICNALGIGVPLLLPLLATLRSPSAMTAQRVRPYLRLLKLSYIAGILALFLA